MRPGYWTGLLGLLFLCGCSLWRQPAALPVANSVVLDQLVVNSNFRLPPRHRLLVELNSLRDHIADTLALPTSEVPINVFLFKTPRRYRKFLKKHFPEFPYRRAFFVEDSDGLNVYAHWNDHVAEDLRHEVAHGYLHSMVSNLPLWLDEGLAEYFEVSRTDDGYSRTHHRLLTDTIASGKWRPDLRRLERLEKMTQLTQLDYAEAWAWVRFLLHGTPQQRQLLDDFLAALRNRKRPEPISEKLKALHPQPSQALALYIGNFSPATID